MKYIIVTILVGSLLLCCNTTWHEIIFGANMSMESQSACDIGNMGENTDMNHTSVILSSAAHTLQYFSIELFVTVLSLLVLVMLLGQPQTYYFKCIRDRYGGFLSFVPIISLFRRGILHPQIF